MLLISVMGALIAYFADLLGRHIGKKRLKLFSWLRPKYTAAVLAAAAGFFIPIITVGIVYLLSSDVRVWLTEGRRAVAQRDVAIRERDAMTKEAKSKAEDVKRLNDQALVSQKNLDLSNKRVAELNGGISKLVAEAARLKISVAQARAQLSAMTSNYATLKHRFDTLQPEYKLAVQTRDEAIKQRNEAHKELEKLNNDLTSKDKELKDKQKRLDDLTNEYKTFQKVSDDKIADQTKLIKEGTERLDSLKNEIESKKLELDRMQSRLDQLQTTFDVLTQGFESGRKNPMIFSKADELARITLPAQASEAEARSAVTMLLRASSTLAEERGAVDLFRVNSTAGLPPKTADELTAEIIKQAAGSKTPVVLITRSTWNAFKGEWVPLQVDVLPNPIVYSKDHIIAEAEVDGRLTDDAIIGAINEFVAKTLGPKAIRDGMIPAMGQDQPLGEIKRETVLELVRQIHEAHRNVRLVALAAKDTHAADRLEIDFKLR